MRTARFPGWSRRRLMYLLVGIQVAVLAAIVGVQELNRALDSSPGAELEIKEAHAGKDPFRGASVSGQVVLNLNGLHAEVVGGRFTPGERVLAFFISEAGSAPRIYRVERLAWGSDPLFDAGHFSLPGRVLPEPQKGSGSRRGPEVRVGVPPVLVELELPQYIPIPDTALDQLADPSLLRASLRRGALGYRYLTDVRIAGQGLTFQMSFACDPARDRLVVLAPKPERYDRRPSRRDQPPRTSFFVFDGSGKEIRSAEVIGQLVEGAVNPGDGTLFAILSQERFGYGLVRLAQIREDGTVLQRSPQILFDRVLGFDAGTGAAWVLAGPPTTSPQAPFFVQRMTLDGLTQPRLGPFASRPRSVLAQDQAIWVVESDQHRVTRFDPAGRVVREYRDLNRPTEIAADGGSLFAAEANQTQLTRFAPDGTVAWRVPRFQGLAWILPEPGTGGGWVGATRYENAEGGVFRYDPHGKIARLPVGLSPRAAADWTRNRLSVDAVHDPAHGRLFVREPQAITILGADGTLVKRVEGFRFATPRPLGD
jgi:hypothetical protein